VTSPGNVDDTSLDALYRAAVALALPSRYEGFGLPVIEAMARGCPVVTTSAACLPEVAGGAADLVDVGDVNALAGALERLLVDDGWNAEQAAAGRERAQQFSWQASAAAHAAAYAAALETPR
jgi:alpha-1,3-rhamnosyl/mannosyltransferase